MPATADPAGACRCPAASHCRPRPCAPSPPASRVDAEAILARFGAAALVSVRPSPVDPDWGGPGTILNIGMNDDRHAELAGSHGEAAATALYLRFVQSYATHVARLDPDAFAVAEPSEAALKAALAAYEAEMDEPFPQDPGRAAHRGAALDGAGLGGDLGAASAPGQGRAGRGAGSASWCSRWRWGSGRGLSGSGVIQFVDPVTGRPQVTGRYLGQSQGRDALADTEAALYLTRDQRGPSLEEVGARGLRRPAALRRGLPRRGCARRCRSSSPSIPARSTSSTRSASPGRRAPRCGSRWRWPRTGSSAMRRRCCGSSRGRCPSCCTARSTRAPAATASPAASPPARARRSGRIVFSSAAAQASAGAGRALHPGAARDRARGYPRHACRRRRADRARRHHQPCRGDRPRPWPALRRRRLRPEARTPATGR